MEADAFGFIDRAHLTAGHSDVRALCGDLAEPLIGDLPVRAAIEVLQDDIHANDAKP
jgi:hypothetical protein